MASFATQVLDQIFREIGFQHGKALVDEPAPSLGWTAEDRDLVVMSCRMQGPCGCHKGP